MGTPTAAAIHGRRNRSQCQRSQSVMASDAVAVVAMDGHRFDGAPFGPTDGAGFSPGTTGMAARDGGHRSGRGCALAQAPVSCVSRVDRMSTGRSVRGAFLFGDFLLGKQEKVTRRAWMRVGMSHGRRTPAKESPRRRDTSRRDERRENQEVRVRAIQSSMMRSRMASGIAPLVNTWLWKARISKRLPSAAFARSRSSRIFSMPTLYASA
jgi:hypothetical protein